MKPSHFATLTTFALSVLCPSGTVALAASSAPARAGVYSSSSALPLRAMPIETETAASKPLEVETQQSSAAKGGNVEYEWKVEEGESAPTSRPSDVSTSSDPQEAHDYLLDIKGVDGETTSKASKAATMEPEKLEVQPAGSTEEKKKGNVDYQWKVEEGESAPGSKPDDIDAEDDPQPITPDFSILLGGGDSEDAQKNRDEVAKMILEEVQKKGESSRPMESLSLNYTKIEMKVKDDAKLFGFIPISIPATVVIDQEGVVKVSFPFWGFLASGKDEEDIGNDCVTALGAALIELRDAMKKAFMVK